MLSPRTLTLVLTFLAVPLSLNAASPVFKCINNGSVSYQSSPCPAGEVRPPPTVEQLNAAQQKKLRDAGNAPTAQPAAPAPGTQTPSNPAGASGPPARAEPFKCDGRIHCSQMTSCAEAKFFLRHCPGVKMDGDGNGIPCEKQWCSR